MDELQIGQYIIIENKRNNNKYLLKFRKKKETSRKNTFYFSFIDSTNNEDKEYKYRKFIIYKSKGNNIYFYDGYGYQYPLSNYERSYYGIISIFPIEAKLNQIHLIWKTYKGELK